MQNQTTQQVGQILETIPSLPKTKPEPLKSEWLCECGRPVRVVNGRNYPKCEDCWQAQIDQEKILEQKNKHIILRQNRIYKAKMWNCWLSEAIPPLFRKAHLRDLSQKIKDIISKLPPSKGLYLFGSAGTGKSHTMAAIIRKYTLEGKKCKRISWDKLCLLLRQSYGRSGGLTELDILQPYLQCDCLFIEDIGTTVSPGKAESDFALRTLLLLLDERIEQCKPTYITSNKSIEQLRTSFDERITSRIVGSCEILPISGTDKRLKK
jgi:DNA replication protein DnaC